MTAASPPSLREQEEEQRLLLLLPFPHPTTTTTTPSATSSFELRIPGLFSKGLDPSIYPKLIIFFHLALFFSPLLLLPASFFFYFFPLPALVQHALTGERNNIPLKVLSPPLFPPSPPKKGERGRERKKTKYLPHPLPPTPHPTQKKETRV